MVSIEYVGWFSDLPHGLPDSPALVESTEQTDAAARAALSGYLDRGAVVAESLGMSLTDRLSAAHEPIGPMRTLTDGFYVWPSDYAYYVEHYGAWTPPELVSRATERPGYTVDPDRLDEIVNEVFGS